MCKRKYDLSDATLYETVTEAFPIIVFAKQLENRERKIMEIMECEIKPNGERNNRTLYRYNITENYYNNEGKLIINGYHEKVSDLSEGLKKRFIENGMPQRILEKIICGEAITC